MGLFNWIKLFWPDPDYTVTIEERKVLVIEYKGRRWDVELTPRSFQTYFTISEN